MKVPITDPTVLDAYTHNDPYLQGALYGGLFVILFCGAILLTLRYFFGFKKQDTSDLATKSELQDIRDSLDEWVKKFSEGMTKHHQGNCEDFAAVKNQLTKLEAQLKTIDQREVDRDSALKELIGDLKKDIRSLREKMDK